MPTCVTCNTSFEIDNEDHALLAKLSEVNPGTLSEPRICPDCRQMRRMSFRNERTLYERTCDVTNAKIISVHAPDSPYQVCEKNYWYEGKFDPMEYGQDYDLNRPFFEQFDELLRKIPLPSLRVEASENCEFNNDMRACNNCYLCSRTHESADMMYTYRGNKSDSCLDCTQVTRCEACYECVECVQCHSSKYLFFCSDCADSAFLLDCKNCMNCFMCTNLRQKQFCFMNEQLTKEEYEKKVAEFDFGSQHMVDRAYELYATIRKQALRPALVACEGCTGDNVIGCSNCHMCFGVQSSQDGRYLWDLKLYKDSMDAYTGGRDSELIYNSTSASGSYGVTCCVRTSNAQYISYSMFITACKHLFGCIGLQSKQYCILNKEYSEEEYDALVGKIVEQMQSNGTYGEFFPANVSPFPYNDTAAHELFPLTEDAASKLGYRWQQKNPKEYQRASIQTPDNIDDVDKSICDATLACSETGKNYKITPQELQFYKNHRLPIPHLCPDVRHARRLEIKNPMRLRTDTCKKCEKEITTTYPEETDMQVVCGACYEEALY